MNRRYIEHIRVPFRRKMIRLACENEYRIVLKMPEELLLAEECSGDIFRKGQFKRGNILIPFVDYKFKRDNIKHIVTNPFIREENSMFELGIRELLWQNKMEDGHTKIDVKFEDETVWLTQAQLCELYQTSKSNISEHIKHIFEEGELEENSVVRKFRTTAADGKKYNTIHYNLDMIISLGYRVKSKIATNFRRWATERLKEYMIKGFTMDDERLKNLGGGNYWKELLDRIRDIRSSEKVMYRQVLDLYATSVDYDPKSSESIAFFKMVQNKLHYAAHGHTAAEVIYERADASQPFMGLNNIVSGYFDFAEIQAMRHHPMYMSDYVEHLDNVLKTTGKRCCRMPVQSVMRRQLRRRQKSIENIRHRICHRLKRNIWKALKIFKA